ncbi:MAG: hypothetical protein ACJAQ6_000875 [Arenicella sp.]|jgi:hypothetical protein
MIKRENVKSYKRFLKMSLAGKCACLLISRCEYMNRIIFRLATVMFGLMPLSASATGVSFGSPEIFIVAPIILIGVFILSLYGTNYFAKKHKRQWYWAI